MKNQYFGDQNDYFKYDLLAFLAEELSGIRKLSIVWMLTEDDGSKDGQKTRYEKGSGDRVLYRFLQKALDDGTRNVKKLEEYFEIAGHRFSYCSYGAERVFIHRDRAAYFRSIPNDNLKDAVIFLDPDNGIEVKTIGDENGHKYMTTDEIEQIYKRMGPESVLVIYQHLPRKHRKLFFYSVFSLLIEKLGCPMPVSISDNVIAFIILAKDRRQQKKVRNALSEFTRSRITIYD